MDQNKAEISGDNSKEKDVNFLQNLLNKKTYRIIFGLAIGAVVGWLYWEFIGCNSGSCPLTNNLNKTVLLFSIMGGFMARKR
jgi:hypothetical protein